MKLSFLHISDLHFKSEWPEEIELVSNKFIEDLAIQLEKTENPYLVFSGDVVSAADNANIYSMVSESFVAKLDKLGISHDRRICVPGNHDVSQSALKPLLSIQKGSLTEMRDEKTFNDNVSQLTNAIFQSKFKQYVDWESSFAKFRCCSSNLGGTGWELTADLGIYCLNSALCSYAGLKDSNGIEISDKDKLLIDTRSLYRWMSESSSKTRVLVMHHPIDWLSPWAKNELENAIADKFHLIFSGHAHRGVTSWSTRGIGGAVYCSAPALFSNKSDLLGYSFVTIDDTTGSIEVMYRQWSHQYKFVLGTSLANNDSGVLQFPISGIDLPFQTEIDKPSLSTGTLEVLEAEFNDAITCYSSKKQIWVERDLANMPETASDNDDAVLTTPSDISKKLCSCIIRAPKEFGLTSVGRFIALEHFRHSESESAIVMLDSSVIPAHRQGVIKHIQDRCSELIIDDSKLDGIILDNWQNDKKAYRVLDEIKQLYPTAPIIILYGFDDCSDIASAINLDASEFTTLYLWSLTRARIRELVRGYLVDLTSLDDDLVTEKIISDIDALNIHRTPLNCLLILKLAEQAFDDSPVNRTDMIGRVLYLLFYQFDKIPRYATRPDIKDCEYALGYVCEWMIRNAKPIFTKNEFYEKTQEYCKSQLIDLDSEVLFSFLVSENIFIRKGTYFTFRFSYWLFFFAAHRMHHSQEFADFILSEGRYSAFPEIIEFYTGIDRRRSDAIKRLVEDLRSMNSDFLMRTGINEQLNPFQHALWSPSDDSIDKMLQQVSEGVSESTLPAEVKDAIADKSYDRSKPYRQEIAEYIQKSTLIQMVRAMQGAARALRNSDHVAPDLKKELLREVMNCWLRVCQILVVVSPVLAMNKSAVFEGMGFCLDKSFDDKQDKERWQSIMTVIPDNVVNWFQEDIFSKKLGALLGDYATTQRGKLGELFIMLIMAKQRPPGWEKEIEQFIVREKKNSFYLFRVYDTLYGQYRASFTTERTRQQLRKLAAMSIAKHKTGSKHPNMKLVEKAAKAMGLDQNNNLKA
ncbi:metallophosphoesterase [Geobacter sulfurreducens]|uniref:metallophosphoesterase n=1 Tax=Geobacter sulfurreducens TaxID=35554 RepID=UPI000DBB29C8|nr:metallophosphoesterase [Geobacter sulfurreducens]BBA70049.1 hypothetical protein YM18_1514 [Geobacter sulfurreducens]